MKSKRMRRSIIRRVLQFIPVLLGITFLAFLLIYLSPSDPVSVRMSAGGISVSPEIMESMRRSMGLDRPLLVQYGDWLWNILHGNMGKSYITDADVLDQILKALPYTLKMAGASLLLTLGISIPVGILTAAMQNSKFDYVVRVMAFVGNALPNFIIALCLMFIFSYRLGWIPVLATTKPIGLILPALTLALVMSSRYIRQIRAAMLDELGKGYVVGLRSRGLSETTILYKNVLKNIMVTVITLTGISLGSLLGGTVIVETVFTWPGLGSLIMEGISQRDYPVVQAVIVWMASAFMVVNLLTDISYTVFNPKIKDI
ncbi:ABC transporter, permease protein [Dialister invisus DSM 15470]|jgi:ABC-type dipeptide/oligopeptide/nickel transport system permease component|uniref:Nickel import system permease protein NikB n=1 Tax=Dialister invisus DSM 15470 TaxID=592028 RepID=C9LNI5_9FIRM|nr:nickel ABC transporter permease [Dialister invisus]EEW97121.1 ABC transporter, permease protein [Dialister invisus DSM 15470]